MIVRIALPLALIVAAALPAFAQDRTLPMGAYQNPTTYGNARTGDVYGVNPTLLQGRSEAPVTRRSHRSDDAR